MDRKLAPLILLAIAAGLLILSGFQRGLQVITTNNLSVVNISPTVVNFSGMPSSETGSLGSQSHAGTGFCPSESFCTQLADASLAGNAIIVFYKYKPASGNTADVPTIADDQSNTYTHCGTDGNNSTNDFYVGCYYKLNATTGTRAITLTWANANTNVTGGAIQVAGITTKDVYATNSWTSTSTTFSSGSATSTANGDLWFEFACSTNTIINVGAFTTGSQAGITWQSDARDRRDGCALQHGVQTTAGALNPQLTNATAYDGVALGVCFKALTTQGTLPTGMYVSHIYHASSSAAGSSNLSYQLTSYGNLKVAILAGGGAGPQFISAVSDSVDGSWTACGPGINSGGATTGIFYKANATAGDSNVTLTVSGTGDTGPSIFYDIAGAATTQECNYAGVINNNTVAAATVTSVTNFAPSASNGIVFATDSTQFNTLLGSTQGGQDCFTYGNQSLSGPSYPDQNNGCTHWSFSDNTPHSLTWKELEATQAMDANSAFIAAFQAPAATLYPIMVKHAVGHSNAAGTSVTLSSYVPFQAGDTLAVMVYTLASCGTISLSDTVNTYTVVDGPTTVSGSSTFCLKTFYAKNIAATTVTLTGTVTTSSQKVIFLEEWANVSTTAPLDQHDLKAATTDGTGLFSGNTLTTLSANEGLFMATACQNNCDDTSNTGHPVQPWTQADGSTFGDISGFLTSGATGNFTAQAVDVATGATDGIATMTFKQ